MPPAPSPDHALRELAGSTTRLRRAVETGELAAAGELLSRRAVEIEALRRALERRPLAAPQLEELAEVLRQGEQTARLLAVRRETARAQFAELESERRRLLDFAPQQPAARSRLDLSG
mgnify:CR=1 FL=1